MRKSWRQRRKEKISALRREAALVSHQVRTENRLAMCRNHYVLKRVMKIESDDGVLLTTWKVYETGDPAAPLAVDFGGKVHRYMRPKKLNALIGIKFLELDGIKSGTISRKIFEKRQ